MAENAAENLGDEELRIETEPFGLAPEEVDSLARELAGHPAVLDYLSGANHRLLAAELPPPAQKTDEPALPDRFSSTFYDYTNNRAVLVTGPLDDLGRTRVEESGQQPLPSPEEVAA